MGWGLSQCDRSAGGRIDRQRHTAPI